MINIEQKKGGEKMAKREIKVVEIGKLIERAEKGILSNNHLFLSNEKLYGEFLPAFFAIYQEAGGEFVWQGYRFSYIPEMGGWEIEEVNR